MKIMPIDASLPMGERIDPQALKQYYSKEDREGQRPPDSLAAPESLRLEKKANGSWFSLDDPGEIGYGKVEARNSVTDREAQFLSSLAFKRVVLEIGTGVGVSAGAMSKTARAVHTIDPAPWVANRVFPHLQLLGNVVCHTEFSAAIPVPVDMVFIDGYHMPSQVAEDFALAMRVCRPSGLIVFHDWRMPEVQDGCSAKSAVVPVAVDLFVFGLISPEWVA